MSAAVQRDATFMPYASVAVDLSVSMPEEEALEALISALDSFRPASVAFELLSRFGDDQRVLGLIKDRLNGVYETAAKLAPIALTALGAPAGFGRLVELLRSEGKHPDSEDRVVIAQSVAEAWITLRNDPSAASAEILSRYDDDELASRCTLVGTEMLTWHVGPVIAAWPTKPAVMKFALEALRRPRSLTRGIMDPAPAAIIRAYAPQADQASQDMVAAVLDQLAYLPPDTREVLTAALTESDLAPSTLIDLLGDWNYDPDIWVQRAAISGLVQRYNRYRLSGDADPDQVDETASWLRQQIRAQLCAYGPDYEDRRQNAWVAMLQLGELTLHDGLVETINEPSRPGVQLAHTFTGVDLEFVNLLNANWDTLVEHFGESELFLLLSEACTKSQSQGNLDAARKKVLLQLTLLPSPHARIHDWIMSTAESDSEFRNDPAFIAWLHQGGRRDAPLFEAALNVLCARRFNDEPHGIYEILVDANAWEMSNEATRELIQGQKRFEMSEALMSLFAERFPNDPVAQSRFTELEEWFRTDGPREPRQWPETLALAVSVSSAEVLPTIVRRAYQQLQQQDAPQAFRDLTEPLLRRLRRDTEAVKEIFAAMQDPFAAQVSTPLWEPPLPSEPPTSDDIARASYFYARLLQRAGMLPPDIAAEVRAGLLETGATAIVCDPFLGQEASLRSLSGLLVSRHR